MSANRAVTATRGGFLHLPSTPLGRISALIFLAGVVTYALTAVFSSRPPDTPNPPDAGLNVGVLAGMVLFGAALVTGLIALVRDRERSWAVWLAVLFPLPGMPLLVLELFSLVTQGS
jgi:hypothetical protein